MESWVSLGGKKGHTIIQILAEPESNWGPCGRKAEISQLQRPMSVLGGHLKDVQLQFITSQ